MKKQKIALIDCNSFFCSCELVFAPKFVNTPVVVLSSNDGCVIARNREAKQLGVAMAAPFFEIQHFVRQKKLTVFSTNFRLYGDLSSRVMQTIGQFSPSVEVYSIDEAFIDLSDLSIDITQYGQKIRQTIYQQTGIPVSVGIASTKVLTKMANHFAKEEEIHHGVLDLSDFKICEKYLRKFPVEEVWGIGWKSAAKLQNLGVMNAFQLMEMDTKIIRKLLGIQGADIVEELRGNSKLDIDVFSHEKKNILSSRSFGKPIRELDLLKEAVAYHITLAAEKMRRQNSACRSVSVFICTSRFKPEEPQHYGYETATFLSATEITNRLIHQAHLLLEKIYRPNFNYKKAGILLSAMEDAKTIQTNWLEELDTPKQKILMKTLDQINEKNGSEMIRFAASGVEKTWQSSSRHRSPCYTTRWSDILKVKI